MSQLCAGHADGRDRMIRSIFEEETEAILLVEVSNALTH